MKEKRENDFLNILRLLNKENINQSSSLRDSFFKSLMVCDNNILEYFNNLTDIYYKGFEKQYKGNIAKNFILSTLFGNEIKNQLTDNLIKDKITCLYIDNCNASYVLTYVGSIKGMRKLIETSPNYFDFFKESMLNGLITRYCNNFVSGKEKNISRLNKLVVIYLEHFGYFEEKEENLMILDEEFFKELMNYKNKGIIKVEDSSLIVRNLINRKFQINPREYFILECEKKHSLKYKKNIW